MILCYSVTYELPDHYGADYDRTWLDSQQNTHTENKAHDVLMEGIDMIAGDGTATDLCWDPNGSHVVVEWQDRPTYGKIKAVERIIAKITARFPRKEK